MVVGVGLRGLGVPGGGAIQRWLAGGFLWLRHEVVAVFKQVGSGFLETAPVSGISDHWCRFWRGPLGRGVACGGGGRQVLAVVVRG